MRSCTCIRRLVQKVPGTCMSAITGPPAPIRARLLSIERRLSTSSNDSATAVAASEHSRRTSLRNELVAFKRALSTDSTSTERLDLLSSSPGSPSAEEVSLDTIDASVNRHAHIVIGMLACLCPTVFCPVLLALATFTNCVRLRMHRSSFMKCIWL